MTTTPLVLHVWPGRWHLPSIDASCLEAILFLQLAFTGLYALVETADPDQSPSGQLPFLTHGQIVVSPLPSIISYLSTLNHALLATSDSRAENDIDPSTVNLNLDAGLSTLQLSQSTAWRAYFEAQLGDLVAHSFFVLEPNFAFTHATLSSMLPVPQRYYVPRRIKQTYRPRLEAVGLWLLANEPEELHERRKGEKHGETKEEKYKRAFDQTKLAEKARLVFDILTRLIKDEPYIFPGRATSVDLTLASRILLLIHTPLPNSALKDLLNTSYPSLVSHAIRVHTLAFPASNPRPQILPPPHVNALNVFKSTLSHLIARATSSPDESEEVKRFRRYRWGWYTLAVVGAVGYIMTQGLGPIRVVIVKRVDDQPKGSQEVQGDGYEEEEEEEEEKELLDDREMEELDA